MMTVGRKMRQLRRAKNWTLAELAKRSGVALSSLSRIETSRMTGTLESHLKIARALEVRLAELYEDLDTAGPAAEYRQGIPSDQFDSGKGAGFTLLAKEGLRKKMLPMIIHLKPGKSTQREQNSAGTEKFLYLLKGTVEVMVGKETVRLNPGDSVYLQASHTHLAKNTGSRPALLLSISSPPAL